VERWQEERFDFACTMGKIFVAILARDIPKGGQPGASIPRGDDAFFPISHFLFFLEHLTAWENFPTFSTKRYISSSKISFTPIFKNSP